MRSDLDSLLLGGAHAASADLLLGKGRRRNPLLDVHGRTALALLLEVARIYRRIVDVATGHAVVLGLGEVGAGEKWRRLLELAVPS